MLNKFLSSRARSPPTSFVPLPATHSIFSLTQAWSGRPQWITILHCEGIPSSDLVSLVSESIGRREGDLEIIVGLEGKMGCEEPEEWMGTPRTEKPDCGSCWIMEQGVVTLWDSSMWMYPQSSCQDDPSQSRQGARPCDLRYAHFRALTRTPNHSALPLKWFSATSPASKSFAYHYEDFFYSICEPAALLFA